LVHHRGELGALDVHAGGILGPKHAVVIARDDERVTRSREQGGDFLSVELGPLGA
jgi:hypothetical protein